MMYYVLTAIIAALVVVVARLLTKREEVVTLESPCPDKEKYYGMKFQNEIAPYIYKEDGKIKLKVVKHNK